MFLTFLIFHQCQDTIVSAVKKSIFQWLISNLRFIILQRLDAIHFLSYLSVAVVDTKLIIHFGKSIPIIVILALVGITHLVGDSFESFAVFICLLNVILVLRNIKLAKITTHKVSFVSTTTTTNKSIICYPIIFLALSYLKH